MGLRHYWTEREEDLLCMEVMDTYEMLKAIQGDGRSHMEYWTMVAGRLWPGVKVTAGACRKRYAECKARFFLDMQADMAAKEEMADTPEEAAVTSEELAKWDELYAQADSGVTELEDQQRMAYYNSEEIIDRLSALEVAVLRLCKAWDVKAPHYIHPLHEDHHDEVGA